MPINAPYWKTQKMTFRADSGGFITLQNNPSKFTLVPFSQVQAALPAQLGPLIINGPVEYPPQGVVLSWDEMSKTDYDQLAQYINLQPAVMIDMEDRGWYGMLKLGKFDYNAGAVQKMGSVDAIFICTGPANGIASVINSLSQPSIPSQTLSGGGSIASGTSLHYSLTLFSTWGESTPCDPFSITTSADGSANTIVWTRPTSGQFVKARLYASALDAGVMAGATTFVMAEVWAPFTQSWIDTTGLNGLTNQATIPTVNRAYTGSWNGGQWVNGS